MSFDTNISYLTRQIGLVTGCTSVSPGCDNCYARRLARRWGHDFSPTMHPELLDAPTRWKKRHVVGVCFHGDLFHQKVSDEFILAAFTFMARTPQHTYVVPTKRVKRMVDLLRRMGGPAPANIWWMASVEDQERAEERLPYLMRIYGHVAVSLAPQIGLVDLEPWLHRRGCSDALPHAGLSWVVQECESGPGRRPFDLAWARQVRDACAAAHVPYYLKQLPLHSLRDGTEWLPVPGKIVKQPLLDGRRHLDVPWEVDRG